MRVPPAHHGKRGLLVRGRTEGCCRSSRQSLGHSLATRRLRSASCSRAAAAYSTVWSTAQPLLLLLLPAALLALAPPRNCTTRKIEAGAAAVRGITAAGLPPGRPGAPLPSGLLDSSGLPANKAGRPRRPRPRRQPMPGPRPIPTGIYRGVDPTQRHSGRLQAPWSRSIDLRPLGVRLHQPKSRLYAAKALSAERPQRVLS
jgi:hypothetical protein